MKKQHSLVSFRFSKWDVEEEVEEMVAWWRGGEGDGDGGGGGDTVGSSEVMQRW